MKKLLSIIVVSFISLSAKSQSADILYNVSKDSARMISDELASLAKRKFVYSSTFENLKAYAIIFKYRDANDESNELKIYFSVNNVGENRALEIQGTPRYYFYMVQGKFLDVFPFWKKYIEPEADAEKMSNIYRTTVILKSSGKYNPHLTLSREYDEFKILLQ